MSGEQLGVVYRRSQMEESRAEREYIRHRAEIRFSLQSLKRLNEPLPTGRDHIRVCVVYQETGVVEI